MHMYVCVYSTNVINTLCSRPSDESHPQVTADGYVDNLAQGVDILLASRTTDQ